MNIPAVDVEATGARINELRIAKGMSVKDVQEMTGVSLQAVYHWQYGMSVPTLDNLVVLACIFDTTLDGIVVTR